MIKIDGKYKQIQTENLQSQINKTDSITKRHHLLAKYLDQRCSQIEKILANIEDDDIDTTMVIEQLWEDLYVACQQIRFTINRIDSYADKHKLEKFDGKLNIYDQQKEQIYKYLLEELYPVASCDTCQYSDVDIFKVPCSKCSGNGDKYKPRKGIKADLKRMTKDIIKIFENYGTISN